MASPPAPASPANAHAIDLRELPWIRPLAADYGRDFGRLAAFYRGDPQDPDVWRAVIGDVQAAPRDRTVLVEALHAQLTAREAPSAAHDAAATLADPRAVAVVTGQQAGLFGGPLYTLHKAITAIKLARQVARDHGVPAVAVFWIDSEDHDWEEVRHCTILDDVQAPRTVTLGDTAGAGTLPIASLTLDHGAPAAVDTLAGALPATDFTPALLEMLRAAYAPGRGMADAFGRVLDQVLGPYGLVVYDAADRATKPLVRTLFAKALQDPGRTSALAAAAGAALTRLGYHAQVTPSEQSAPLFSINDGRHAVKWHDGAVSVGDREMSTEDAARWVAESPETFSPNVLLRPLTQDTIFPTVCYVGGPAEVAYFGQLRDIYAHFGLPMPLIVPRASASLVDSATLRFLDRHGDLAFASLQRQDEHTLNRLLESQLPPAIEQSFADAGAAIAERLAAVTEAARAVDATLDGAAKSTLGKMQHDLQALHGKVVHAAKRKDETLRRQFTRAQTMLFPTGHPQERVVGLVWLINRYGPAAVERLFEVLPVDGGHHWVLAI